MNNYRDVECTSYLVNFKNTKSLYEAQKHNSTSGITTFVRIACCKSMPFNSGIYGKQGTFNLTLSCSN